MTNLVKLIAADRPVRLMPDTTTANDLRKLRDFWSDEAADRPERDLPTISDKAMLAALAEEGVEADMPDAVRNMVQGGRHVPLAPLGLAACLVGAIGVASFMWPTPSTDETAAVSEQPPGAFDPYVLARPDRPATGAARPPEPAPGSGLQAAAVRSSAGDGDGLTRPEIHEMQRLLTHLGYGPLVQNGLPSKALDDAMSRFRIDQGLDPEGLQPREGLVMLRLAARAEALRARRDDTSDR